MSYPIKSMVLEIAETMTQEEARKFAKQLRVAASEIERITGYKFGDHKKRWIESDVFGSMSTSVEA